MVKKKKKKSRGEKGGGRKVPVYGVVAVLLLGVGAYYLFSGSSQSLEEKSKDVTFPTYAQKNSATLKAYQIAVAEPELLKAIPCYCGCAGVRNEQYPDGHKNLYNCYLDDEGRFTSHASYCTICINEALESYEMLKDGKSLREIRESIDSKYFGKYGMPTPTPVPQS